HGQEEVTVLDARGNAAQVAHFAQVVIKEPTGDLVRRDRGEYGHTLCVNRNGWRRAQAELALSRHGCRKRRRGPAVIIWRGRGKSENRKREAESENQDPGAGV